ncbi:polyamine aminopropyltransferase [Pararhodospirillum photometricum]|uniref:Polyamine aminopropyltransferase n=1 Tax=Pararhodospirillum photometricum DSM 122 TaxID=1150469 RepID=H6SSF6_PARPM|nr:polyamine aminopropyltransferase [Pararhodospirillum photometricum]CCG07835.1 Spermidine synthase [Pararhodospirillum photometricum DSM 122]
MTDDWIAETLHPAWRQTFLASRVLYREKTDLQDLVILENPTFGRVMLLDGVTQLTERDEFVYHEMMAHVPLIGHGAARRVLIIGGGDGGTLREVLRHPGVEQATMVEIDRSVVDRGLEYMPSVSAGAFDDPRTHLLIADGIRFVAETTERFDVILVDSTDPTGPAAGLFTPEFYADCKRCLTEGGILVVQAGVPFLQPDELPRVQANLRQSFASVGAYVLAAPTYVGGFMTLGWASDDASRAVPAPEVITARVQAAGLTQTRYYTDNVHAAAFALPAFIGKA